MKRSLCVCLLVVTVNRTKSAEPITVTFEASTQVGVDSSCSNIAGPILSVLFPALIVHSELKSVHPGFPVAFIF